MIGQTVRGTLMVLTVLSLSPARADAYCGWWNRWFGAAPVTTYYAPYTAAYAPAGYGQTVNYMPQTCYRTVYVNTPVVAYRPVAACDACGGATTVMRPVVSYVPQARLVPYTTYRPVVAAAPACGFCGTVAPATTYYAPAMVAPAVAAPAPCCGASAAAPMTSGVVVGTPGAAVPSLAPSLNYPPTTQGVPPAAAYPSVPSPSTYAPSTGAPAGSLPPANNATPPATDAPQDKTFDNPSDPNKPAPESRLLLPPQSEPEKSNTNGVLRGLDPEDQDRITALPMRQALAVRPVSATSVSQTTTYKQADTIWRSARP
jgi:hypothetical protein